LFLIGDSTTLGLYEELKAGVLTDYSFPDPPLHPENLVFHRANIGRGTQTKYWQEKMVFCKG
jgi:hypothetical protein